MTASRARLAVVAAMLGLGAWGCGSADKGSSGGAGSGGVAGTSGSAGTSGVAGTSGSAGSGGSAGATTTGAAGSTSTAGAGGGTSSDGGGGAGTGAAGSGADSGAPTDGSGGGGDGAPGSAALTQFLRIIQVTTVQGTTTVSISIDGQKNHTGTIHAAQALMMRIHVRPDTGWVPHPTVAELHLINSAIDVILTAGPLTITGASTAGNLDSTFNFNLTAEQVTKDLKFSVALRDPTGTPETPPPAIQRALYPRTGMLDTLDAQ